VNDQPDPWDVRELPRGDKPSLVLAQGKNRVRVKPVHVKGMVAALADAAAALVEVLGSGRVYHA
jgi:hypothetical protein